ncbi:MAG: S-layer homology domain-containing protein [Firmicutes bacterium]|nr:S-layer homology domain-containing protein [Bacillota bacterium]
MRLKRTLALLISVMLLVSVLPVQAFAAGEVFIASESTMTCTIGVKISHSVNIDQNGAWLDMDLEGTLPKGLDWAYGEAEDPRVYGTPTGSAGTYQVLFVGRSNGSSKRYSHKLTIKVKEPPKTVRSDTSFTFWVGEKYSDMRVNVDRSAYESVWDNIQFSGQLPPGMEWYYEEGTDPRIYGTPTGPAKTYNAYFTGKIYGSDDTLIMAVSIRVLEPKTVKTSETFYLTKGEECDLYTDVDFIGEDKAWDDITLDGRLPNGLSWIYNAYLAPDIYGTPEETGRFDLTFNCVPRDSKNTYIHKVVLVINEDDSEPAPTPIESSQTGEALLGEEGVFLLAEEMGVDFNADKLVECDVYGALPPGMTWNFHETQGPYLYGTPTEPGTYRLVYMMKTASGKSYRHDLTVTVAEKPAPPKDPEPTASNIYLYLYVGDEFEYTVDTNIVVLKDDPITYADYEYVEAADIAEFSYDSYEMPRIKGKFTEPGNYEMLIRIWQDKKRHDHTVHFEVYAADEKPAYPVYSEDELRELGTPFNDVPEDVYYDLAVLWAYNADPQITDGNGKDKFMPEQLCTRGQVVTFLWRAAGCPEPVSNKNPFNDVKTDDYFYKPVLWAVEQGITEGTSPTTFNPAKTCSNAHILTFLYRAVGAGEDGWYQEAFDWARSGGILGESYTEDYDVTADCPRKNVVYYLFNYADPLVEYTGR